MKRILIAMLALLPPAVLAFNIDGTRWANGETVFFVDFEGVAPSGISWNDAFEDAMAQWNEFTDFNYFISNSYRDPCAGFDLDGQSNGSGFPDGIGDGLNGTDFSATVCGNEFGSGVLAITLVFSSGGTLGFSNLAQTDILFRENVNWDVYTGDRRPDVDFTRVALHELGHAMGLGHEMTEPAIMAPTISNLDSLQADDIAGANTIYGGPGNCFIDEITVNSVVNGSLGEGDCAVFELYSGGNDTSFVDVYRLSLDSEQALSISMESSVLDSVLLLTNNKLAGLHFDDDSAQPCNARLSGSLPAGEYLILANTYDTPFKCGGNTGGYRISISDTELPLLTRAISLTGASSNSIFSGGASSDGGVTFQSSFSAAQAIDVTASIQVDPEHIGETAALYVVAIINNSQYYAKLPGGGFVRLDSIAAIPAVMENVVLAGKQEISIAENFAGASLGLAGAQVDVYVGYALESAPQEIFYNGEPIRVTFLP